MKKSKEYKLIYTEQLPNEPEGREDYVILITENIQWSVDHFVRNRYITEYKIIALNEKE